MKRIFLAALLAATLPVYAHAQWDGQGNIIRNNGTHSGVDVWTQDRDAGIKITSTNHDLHDQGLADAIENCVAKDGQNVPTQNLPMDGKAHTGVGNGTARTMYATVGQVQDTAFSGGGVSTGAGASYVISVTPALLQYVAGQWFQFVANHTWDQEGTPTINVNGLGTKDIKRITGTGSIAALRSFDIVAGGIYQIAYDGTRFILINPSYSKSIGTITNYTSNAGGSTASSSFVDVGASHSAYINSTDYVDIVQMVAFSAADEAATCFQLYVDGATWKTQVCWRAPDSGSTNALPMTIHWNVSGLTAGSHTFQLKWKTDSGTSTWTYYDFTIHQMPVS